MQLSEAHRIEVPMNDEKMKGGTIAAVTPGAITPASIEAVAGGYCADPFAILGPHAVHARDAWTVRAFLPQAESAHVLLADGSQVPMERRHKEGFFVAALPGSPVPYRFQVQDWHGMPALIED